MKRLALVFLLALLAVSWAADDVERLRRELNQAGAAERATAAARLAAALTDRGEAEQNRHDHQQARKSFREALGLLQGSGIAPPARLLKGAGLSAIVLGDHRDALELLQRAETAAEREGDRESASASAYLIGYVHRDLENYDLAMRYFQAAYESGQALGNRRRVIMSLNEIGNVHVFCGRFAEAAPYKERSLKLAREHGQPDLLANGLHDMGEFYLQRNQPAKALPLVKEALAIDRRIGHKRGIIISLYTIAVGLRRLGRLDEALAALEEARPLAEEAGQDRDLANILLLASIVRERLQDHRRALEDQRRYHELWERLFSEEKARQTVEMQTRYEVEKKERENELLRREKELAALAAAKGRSQRNFLFVAALMVLLLAAVLFYNFRAKSRANRWLEEANARIVAQQGKLEEAYRKMEDLARSDPLTGLANRRAALEEIGREEVRGRRSHKPFTLVMADLVGFKAVNDAFGHEAGDHVLKEVSALFTSSLRAQDTVARWGGDEFLFLLSETDADGAAVICRSVAEKFRDHPFAFAGRRLDLKVRLGTATCSPGRDIEECLRAADQAMYGRDGGGEGR
jgi:diguanylate cyclase (GGDEF)-like protein